MLRQRVLTALVLAPLAVWGILALPGIWFAGVLGIIVTLGAWEWTNLIGLRTGGRLAYTVALPCIMLALFPLLNDPDSMVAVGVVGLAWWLAATVSILRFPGGGEFWREHRGARASAGLFVLIPAWASLVVLHQTPSGPGFVLLLALLIWGADTGAYFAGRAFGRHKLAPQVSPGKTWEGVGGGALFALLVASVGGIWLEPLGGLPAFLLLVLVTIAFSVLGDLAESMFKRLMDVKDSGGLLPGHGGILDRIDSLTAAAPIFALGLYGLGRLA